MLVVHKKKKISERKRDSLKNIEIFFLHHQSIFFWHSVFFSEQNLRITVEK